MSSTKQYYADYWKEEIGRLKFNLDFMRDRIRDNKDFNHVYWLRCNLSLSGALDANPLVNLDGHCCLIKSYLLTFTDYIEDPDFRLILWQYGPEAALSWTISLIDRLIAAHFCPANQISTQTGDEINNNNDTNRESYLRALALVMVVKLYEPTGTKAGQINRQELDLKLEQALEKLISLRRWRLTGISISDVKQYLEMKTNQIDSDNIQLTTRPVELECQHSFQHYTEKCLRTAIWQEVNRMGHILVPSYPCDKSCKEQMELARPLFNINCIPSRLAYALSSAKVAQVLLEHPFTSDKQWFEHDEKHEPNWPCRCLDLLHDQQFICTWMSFILGAFQQKDEHRWNPVSMVTQLINHYGPPDGRFRRELEGWIGDCIKLAQLNN